MDFRPLAVAERERLHMALRRNTEGAAILTDPKDTSFVDVADKVLDDVVVRAIKSVPTHY